MVDPATAMAVGTAAYKGIKKAMEMGREAQDIAGMFGKFYDAKDSVMEAGQYSKNQPLVKKIFSGESVEAEALRVTSAKHKFDQLEKELREFLLWSGQGAFYEDMMAERRKIKQRRLLEAKRKAENKKFMNDLFIIGGILIGCTFLVFSILAAYVSTAG